MSITICSEKVLKTMDKVLEASKVVNYDKNLVEHFMYILFKHIKLGHNTYNSDSSDFYAFQSFMNFNKMNVNLKQYDFDVLVDDFIESKDKINNNEEFLSFLSQYFVFFHKTRKSEVNQFVKEFLSFASKLDGSAAPKLIQTQILNENKIRDVKKIALNQLNKYDEINFFDVTFHKTGKEKGVILNFHYINHVTDELLENFVENMDKTVSLLNDFEFNYTKNIEEKNWNHKLSERANILGTNPLAKYSMILDDKLIPDRNGVNSSKETIHKMYHLQSKVNKLHCRLFNENMDEEVYKNKLVLSSQLHFTFEEYFDFLIEQFAK